MHKLLASIITSVTALLVLFFALRPPTVLADMPAEQIPNAPLATIVVTSALDSGPGTLRQALLDASGGDVINFDPIVFPPASPTTIGLNSALPDIITDNLTIDGSSAGVSLDGSATPDGTNGFVVNGADYVTIKGLQIFNFQGNGVEIQPGSSHNTIGGNNGSPGGACTGECNLISGNDQGITIEGSGADYNVVSGNYIGTDVSGTASIPNKTGIYIISEASNNTVGGHTLAERNLISGNGGNGISISSNSNNNTVSGNYIGTDASGTSILGNSGVGVNIDDGSQDNTVGGSEVALSNLISGNDIGVGISAAGTMSNTVTGNLIGTDASGSAALGNGNGVSIEEGAQFNTIGGDTPAKRNVISGNDGVGIGLGSPNNIVIGNHIGTDVNGTFAIPNDAAIICSGSHNTIGGSNGSPGGACTGECNLISGNNEGLNIEGNGADYNVVSGNYMGADVNGTAAIPNGSHGILILEGANNIIGGDTPAERNLISGNGDRGILIIDNSNNNTVVGNYIGTDSSGTSILGNSGGGVAIGGGSQYNTIGGSTAGMGNLISGNQGFGIYVGDLGTISNNITGNLVGTDINGTSDLGNGRCGVLIYNAAQTTIGGTAQGDGNIVSANDNCGIGLWGEFADYITVSGNYIGVDINGEGALGNGYNGVHIGGGANTNTIGGATISQGNTIAHNGASGVYVTGSSTLSNTISHNSIYSNTDLGIDLVDGANANVFPPLFTEVSETSVTGIAMPDAIIEIFSDNDDEGRWYEDTVIAGSDGNFTFTKAAGFTGTNVTATATDADGNTSEFTSPYSPSHDVLIAAVYAPQQRHQINVSLTPLVRVGNGGSLPETFTVTAVITRAGTLVYEDQQTVSDLNALNYNTLAFSSWLPSELGSYIFEVAVQPASPDDNPSNDRSILNFSVVDDRVDLWSRDNPSDDGGEPSSGPAWESPDLWVRNTADGLTEPQDPINNITNTVYIRVRNRGTLTATNATVTAYWHPPSLVISQDWWQPIGTIVLGEVAPGEVHTAELDWRPQITGVLTTPYHTCLIDVISSTEDTAPLSWNVQASNNIAQRNVDVISQTISTSLNMASSTPVTTTFSVGNPYAGEQLAGVIINAAVVPDESEVRLDLGDLFERWQNFGKGSLTGATVVSSTTQIALQGGGQAVISGLPLAGNELIEIVMEVHGLAGKYGKIEVSESIGGEVLGGITLLVEGKVEIYLPITSMNFAP
jgi:hypothetical protein